MLRILLALRPGIHISSHTLPLLLVLVELTLGPAPFLASIWHGPMWTVISGNLEFKGVLFNITLYVRIPLSRGNDVCIHCPQYMFLRQVL